MTGLLWFDDGPSPLCEKVARAAGAYRGKFGIEPNTCYVHRSHEPQHVEGVSVVPVKTALKNHFFVGTEEE